MIGTTPAARWDHVLTRLWARSRFTSYFYQFTDLVENTDVPTLALAVNARRFCLFYHPGFVLRTDPDSLIGLLVHEMLHVVLNHRHRMMPGRELHLQNLAQDMVINSYIKEHEKTFFARKGFQESPPLVLPPGLPVIPEAFAAAIGRGRVRDATWEQVYAWLAAGRRTAPDDGEAAEGFVPDGISRAGTSAWRAHGGTAATFSLPDGLTFTNRAGETLSTGLHLFGTQEAEGHRDAGRKRILRFIDSKGECEGERVYVDLSRLMREAPSGRVAWKAGILSIVNRSSSCIRWDHTFSRLNRRYFDAGVYAPGRVYLPKRLVTVAADVSGSMTSTPARIEAAFRIVETLAERYRVSLVCVDQQVFVPRKTEEAVFAASEGRRPYFYRKGDWKCIRTGSRGATFFAPLFNEHMKGHREALIVVTDGHIYDLASLVPYRPTLWAVPAERRRTFVPPFGRVVSMEPDAR